jgi:GDP-L-fucose synthase
MGDNLIVYKRLFKVKIQNKIKNFLNRKKVLVTGGTGMIGRELVRILLDNNCDVTCISLDNLKIEKKVKYIKGDLSDFKLCRKVTKYKDIVFHIAGIKGSVEMVKKKPSRFFVPLLMMNTNILEACRLNNVKNVVYTSSIGAYSSSDIFIEGRGEENPPMDFFPGWAKRIAEYQIQSYKIQHNIKKFSIVRPSNVYGLGDNFDEKTAMVIPSLISKIFKKQNPVNIWGDGNSERDFIHSVDVAVGILHACYYGTNSEPVNLGSGKGIKIKQLVKELNRCIKFNYNFDIKKPSGYPKRIMNMKKAYKTIKFKPQITLGAGLRDTVDWFNNNKQEYLKRKNYFSEK